jgi:C-terminal processing protease CtpA/Prc
LRIGVEFFAEKTEARLPALKLGDETYTDLICTRLSDKNAPSIVGSRFLRQHRVTLDYPNRQIRFQRMRDRTQTEPDMSGIHLKWIRQSAVIASIDPQSPAANVGLTEGDELLQINGQLVMGLGSGGIEDLFRRGNNVTVEIVLLRGRAEITKSIVFKRRI